VNTLLTTDAPERLVHEWYQGLYTDTYSDYLEMARYWYHGHRDVGMWMNRAQEQLGEEEETVFADTNRDAFIALATGNTHAHPNYVPTRRLDSFPIPLHLRKDPRAHYFKEVQTVLLSHTDTEVAPDKAEEAERSAKGLASRTDLRRRALSLLAGQQEQLVERFSGNGREPLAPDAAMVVSPSARVSLEAIDDVVRLVLRAPNGERRQIAWGAEQEIVAAFAEARASRDLPEGAELTAEDAAAFCEELAAAGVLVPAGS
jgi:hypothetical protein